MANNLPDNLKTNWVDNETVMPVNVNGWSSAINKIKDAVPVYSANGNFYTATYGSNIYSLSPITMNGETNVPPSAYIDGMKVVFKCPTNNSANCSVNVNSLGNKSIKNLDGSNIGAGVLVAGNYIELIYDNSQGYFKLLTAHYLPISSVAGKGSASLPVYFDANGKAQPITSYEGNSATATKANQDANGDVIDVTYAKNENLFDKMNQSKAMETGSVSYVEEVLQDVIKYKNSSFDRSKFTAVGSPIITDDGILSNCSANNYITIPFTPDIKNYNFKFKYTHTANFTTTGYIVGYWTQFVQVYCDDQNQSLGFYVSLGGVLKTIGGIPLVINSEYDINFNIDIVSGLAKVTYSKDGVDMSPFSNTISGTPSGSQIFICRAVSSSVFFDLKQFSITVDDEEVFNGHQEGIDVLKPNDFTTVTTIYAYKFGDNTVYSNVTNNTNPTELYNADGSYYLGTAFDIINDKVTYPEQATRGTDDITIEGVTYYEFEHSSTNIYADDPTTPTALFNSDGSEYTGTQWNIMSSKVYYLNDATYTSSANITINRDYNTVDAGVKISDEGIANNFGNDKFLLLPNIDFNSAKSWKIIINYIVPATSQYAGGIISPSEGNSINIIEEGSVGRYGLGLSSTGGVTWDIYTNDNIPIAVNENDTLQFVLFYSNNIYSFQIFNLTQNTYTNRIDISSNDKVYNRRLQIGSLRRNYGAKGSVDLNTCRIYINEKLVYQPMLKIPYIQSASKYGSKIVDEKYRNRVEDAYEQGFEQKYFTLQENDKENFTRVGNPDITDDRLMTRTALNQGITSGLINKIDISNFDVTMSTKILNTTFTGSREHIFRLVGNNAGYQYFAIGKNSIVLWHNTSGTWNYASMTTEISVNDIITFNAKSNGNNLLISVYKNGNIISSVVTKSLTSVFGDSSLIKIETAYGQVSNDDVYGTVQINLDSFKVYESNKLIYHTYIEPNFTLPLGELYGLIESKVPKTSLKEVICIVEDYTYEDVSAFCWDLSNGIRIQGATQTVSANGEMTVPLLKNFADNHYLAFKNYSAGVSSAMQDAEGSIFDKTTSSFKTSNSTGDTTKFDWIAIGKIG